MRIFYQMTVKNTAQYAMIWRKMWVLAMNGQRIYYNTPKITYDDRVGRDVALLFKMKQVIPYNDLADLLDMEFTGTTAKKLGPNPTELYMTRMVEQIKEDTWKTKNKKLHERITYNWPACEFDNWADETFDQHWMTAKFFQEKGLDWYDWYRDYALLVNVYVPLTMTRAEFDNDYGNSFVMTKLAT